ncbi:carbamoylphosphate synthetase [Besnoitia besnoiti]|uniref:Carbamoylphosphate synthetase n=1 Tax=Besnoitia besnoiti TaxID=94643 RepID=A0A2A9MGA1_BESBE|nr:carbamoylphosphate synthetase [Besnoitia besnoiti]PFH37015.1 carbamoylphosphate synthetase [Besnoitia besnoiti]
MSSHQAAAVQGAEGQGRQSNGASCAETANNGVMGTRGCALDSAEPAVQLAEMTAPSYPLDLAGRLKPAMLVLADGREFLGYSFGHPSSIGGEVVFNTGMVGYPESLTDPSYEGQILVLTYPLIGNYGVPSAEKDEHGLPKYFEGDRIYVRALVVADYDEGAVTGHFRAENSLAAWMQKHKVPAIAGVDTRALTKHLREVGCMLGKIVILDEDDERQAGLSLSALAAVPVQGGEAGAVERLKARREVAGKWDAALRAKAKNVPWQDPNEENLVAVVSHKEVRTYRSNVRDPNSRDVLILCVDCGMKYNIYRQLLHSKFEHCNVSLKVVPWDYDFGDEEFDGLFISNGPGDPAQCEQTVQNVKRVMERKIPIFGICLGNQLLALAAGARTYKMKYGNRGMNQPVIDLRTTRCYITPQNHGFAVDESTLPSDFLPLFVNANDRSNEGIIHRTLPFFSAQFHPEASGGPTDTFYLFDDFLASIMKAQTLKQVHTIPFSFPQTYRKVLLLGSGGLSIGQAGEFDYSGSQAIKALKEQNITVVVVNPNIATVQTSKHMADKVYFLPVTVEFVTKVIQKERPDGILCTFGGQTALNCAVKLHEEGILERYGCRVLGTPIEAIIATEDRKLFAAKLAEIGEKVAESAAATSTEEAVQAANAIGYPVLIRAAFALGGLGSGFAEDEEAVRQICKEAFAHSPQVFVDKSLKGWKEVEYEVVRDCKNNCITVCNMENLDPLGIHTGDSIVVAPSQTLSNVEYYRLRDTALKVIRQFGVVGECNIQYALDPNSEKYYIVEVNARLSRSSALASKATGYPLAYIAAKLALGSTLVELSNSVTKETTACFEPSLDYVVTKVPRWDLRKFDSCDPFMGSAMKSVGEVMAIGRTFEESLQKALRMVEEKAAGFDESMCHFFSRPPARNSLLLAADSPTSAPTTAGSPTAGAEAAKALTQCEQLEEELLRPSPNRIWALALALQMGWSVETLHEKTKIDKWFLSKLQNIADIKRQLAQLTLEDLSRSDLFYVKKYGFSDRQIAHYLRPSAGLLTQFDVRKRRLSLGVRPFVKQIDTLAAEFPAHTNYLYLTYQGLEDDVAPLVPFQGFSAAASFGDGYELKESQGAKRGDGEEGDESILCQLGRSRSVANFLSQRQDSGAKQCFVVLGCGCYRIGSSVEFDWSAVSCVRTLRSLGHRAIVVNCNPETVSTDYDVSDRLFFEDLSLETVLNIWDFEAPTGVIISVGGQTPNTLCSQLEKHGVSIVGTSVASIDCCEDRHKFSRLCDELNIDQPRWKEFTDLKTAKSFCQEVGYPVLVRPSYVLSGAAMRVVTDDEQLDAFLKIAAVVSGESPVVISKFVENAKEVEFDSVACRGEIVNFAISEHVENAGTHSGDATLILPGQKLYVETIRRVKKISQKLARALQVSGPFNIQFVCKQNDVKVIECNLRASRTFPFISKTFNVNLIDLATKVMIGAPVAPLPIHLMDLSFVCVKVPVFSFARLRGCDPILGVEMRSTGEVACFGSNKHEAFLKAFVSTGVELPLKQRSILLSTGPLSAKVELEQYIKVLLGMGFTLYATEGTYEYLVNSLSGADAEHTDSVGSRALAADGAAKLTEYLKQVVCVRKPLATSLKEEQQKDRDLLPDALHVIESGKVEMVINVPESLNSRAATNGYLIRRTAIDCGVPLLTDIKVASLFVEALQKKQAKEAQGRFFWEVRSWDEYWPRK